MKVILKQDVKGLGKVEDVVEVSDGYARNYLLPKGMVLEASVSNLNVVRTKKDAEKSKKDKELQYAKDLAEKLKNIVVIIKAKAGETGKLFGSITSKDIVDQLKKGHKITIDKKLISMSDSIKSIGTREVEARLYIGVIAKINVKIEQE